MTFIESILHGLQFEFAAKHSVDECKGRLKDRTNNLQVQYVARQENAEFIIGIDKKGNAFQAIGTLMRLDDGSTRVQGQIKDKNSVFLFFDFIFLWLWVLMVIIAFLQESIPLGILLVVGYPLIYRAYIYSQELVLLRRMKAALGVITLTKLPVIYLRASIIVTFAVNAVIGLALLYSVTGVDPTTIASRLSSNWLLWLFLLVLTAVCYCLTAVWNWKQWGVYGIIICGFITAVLFGIFDGFVITIVEVVVVGILLAMVAIFWERFIPSN